MKRKATAGFSLIIMTLLVMVQHPVFAYCPATNEVLFSSCFDTQELQPALTHDEAGSENLVSAKQHDDLLINAENDHYLPPLQIKDGAQNPPVLISPSTGFRFLGNTPAAQTCRQTPIRGPAAPFDLPLYLKHSVFRL